MFDLTNRKELRAHQVKAIDLLRQSLGKGNRRVVLQAPTGFGKSLTAAKIIESALERGRNVLFTVPRLALINQTVEAFEAEGIRDIGVIQSNHPRTNSRALVQVASVQTLARRDIAADFGLVINDECHLQSEVITKMLKEWACHFVGLSATPWARGMGLLWQDMVQPVTLQELIDGGYLSRFAAFAPSKPDLSGVKTVAGDYAENDLEEIMSDGKLVADIVETWLAKGENRPTIMFGVNRAHARQVHERFQRSGVASEYVDGNTDSVERRVIERRFRSGDVKVVCSVRTLTTGVDWPVSCIIDAAPTKSEMLHVQKIGRGLRINPGTEDCVILDHAGNTLRLGLVTDIRHERLDETQPGDRQERKAQAEKLPKECANCGCLVTTRICPFCHHERRPASGVETVDGELVEVGRVRVPTMGEKQLFWSMALFLDRDRKRDGKLAKGLYKGKFGVWPRGLADIPTQPDQAFMNYEKSRRIAYAKKMEKSRVSH